MVYLDFRSLCLIIAMRRVGQQLILILSLILCVGCDVGVGGGGAGLRGHWACSVRRDLGVLVQQLAPQGLAPGRVPHGTVRYGT